MTNLNLPNIEYNKPKKNPTVDADTSMFALPFYKDNEYFSNLDNFIEFIKAVEGMVRTSKYYKRYVKYIKDEVGLNFCQVMSNIKVEDEEDYTKIEMHHGPILTLFDYVSIITDDMLYHNKKVNTFIVADKVLDEHFANRVQVVMLSETAHELVHDNGLFINIKQAFGDLNGFVSKYRNGLSEEHILKINTYIERSKQYDSYDYHMLDLEKKLISWSN